MREKPEKTEEGLQATIEYEFRWDEREIWEERRGIKSKIGIERYEREI